MVSMKIGVEGMSCGHCVSAVRDALSSIDGVTVEQVEVGAATVTYDPAKTSLETIAGVVENAGYSVIGETSERESR